MVRITEIEDRKIVKPYLGGWRHKVTGTEYLNAASQTGPPPRLICFDQCSRTVQSKETKDESVQSLRDQATQMWRPDCFISSETDKYKTSKPYETYEEMQIRLNYDGNARIIQKNYRTYRFFKYFKQCAREYRRIVNNCKKFEEQKVLAYKQRHEREVLCKTYPKRRTDFDMLYDLIEKWRTDRLKDMKSRFFKAGQCAENYALLQQTIEMFNAIDKHKQAIRQSFVNKKRVKFLLYNCEPVRWNGYKGKPVEMHTMKVQKAREYKSIYDSLTNNDVTTEERIELLIMLKKSLEKHVCITSFNVLHLIDQEILLLSRKIKNLSLDYLRRRITHAYLDFVRDSASCFCADINESPRGSFECEDLREPLETKTMLCKSCRKLFPYYRFNVHSRITRVSFCNSCIALRKRSYAHVNYDPIIILLDRIRADERRQNCYSGLAFLMQQEDMHHLVYVIWRGRSVVSENSDIFLLRLIRFRINEEWAPWNCILLTEEEAEIHYRVRDNAAVYSRYLLHRIFLAHQIAKNHFKRLSIFERNFRESSRYYMIQDRIEYKPPTTIKNYMETNIKTD